MSSYHFPHERRRVERRVAPSPGYTGVERRQGERRQGEVRLTRKTREPMNRWLLWAAVLMVLVLADAEFLDGAYRTMIVNGVSDTLAHVRGATDNLWGWRR